MALNLGAKRTEFLEEPEHKYSDLPWGEFNKYAVDHVVSKKDFLKAFDELVTIQFGVKALLFWRQNSKLVYQRVNCVL